MFRRSTCLRRSVNKMSRVHVSVLTFLFPSQELVILVIVLEFTRHHHDDSRGHTHVVVKCRALCARTTRTNDTRDITPLERPGAALSLVDLGLPVYTPPWHAAFPPFGGNLHVRAGRILMCSDGPI